MEMAPLTADTDERLLGQMFDLDIMSGEVFRLVYGIEHRKHFESYNKSGKLPDQVREYCINFLAKKQPQTGDLITHPPQG